MKNLYILQDINEEKLSELKEENADFIAFDYISHKILAKNKIKHNLIDDYINENDRKEIFQFCSTCLKQYERSNESDLKFHNIDLVSIVDRNELHEFLMDLIPKIKAIKNILAQMNFTKIYASFKIYQLLENNTDYDVVLFEGNKNNSPLTYDKITLSYDNIPFSIKPKLNRAKFRMIKKNQEKITSKVFRLRKDIPEKRK